MKRLLPIFLLFIYVSSVCEAEQLLRLPVLMEHYKEHRSENKNLSFLEFLSMHYSQATDHDGDSDRDEQLPFKANHNCAASFSIAFINTFFTVEDFKVAGNKREYIAPVSDDSREDSYLSSIWQPPKTV